MLREIIQKRLRVLMLAVGIVAGGLVIGAVVVDEGEVVTLVTLDESSREHSTQLWIVDIDRQPYLRASAPDARWLARIEAKPEVILHRGGEVRNYLAVPDRDGTSLDSLNRAMETKYGFADQLWSQILDRKAGVPIRLDPRSAGKGAEVSEAEPPKHSTGGVPAAGTQP
jgi:hypothetical protein